MEIKTVTNYIKDLRYQNNQMSQQELADTVGCTRQTIIALEQNRYSPSFVLVSKIAKVFNVSVDHVLRIDYK